MSCSLLIYLRLMVEPAAVLAQDEDILLEFGPTLTILESQEEGVGLICVSPDYVLISALPQYVEGLKKAYEEMYPADQGAALGSDLYARIINLQLFNRIKGLLEKKKDKFLMGGRMDEEVLKVEPTVVLVKEGDVLVESETFGLILTIVDLEEEGFVRRACDWVSRR
ncbi:hypothetical protein GYMLUDRAFT_251765 [Collybiopsis luxurians FD-317 M1]|uniref:Uncharacterized protein n=1 Tax=Collybiopsis luxurians FD-317 M1 TaxID=944289 RepID=A0A0D0CAA8_9AGAR|nr:hypothetical protein GYMLUDRAFT_251765 [Collybiopsis luxurians FD-317 M1]